MLGFLAAIGPLSTDLYLPSFPQLTADFAVGAGGAQFTMTGFLVGFGLGPLLVGPLSDRCGRRPVLLVSLCVFVVAGLGMLFAWNVGVLIALRIVQGLAGSAGTVLSRAIVADLSSAAASIRALSILVVSVGAGAIAAPMIGGPVAATWGWRGSLATLSLIGALMLTLAALRVPESLPRDQRHSASGAGLLRGVAELTASPAVRAPVILLGAAYAAMLSFTVSSPFVGQVMIGLDTRSYALAFAAAASAMLVANVVNAIVAPHVGTHRMLGVGQLLIAIAALALATCVMVGMMSAAAFVVLGFVLIGGVGLTMSNTYALTLVAAGDRRGAGSALLSTTQYACGAVATVVVGVAGSTSAVPMAVAVVGFALIGGLVFLGLRRGWGRGR